MAQLTGSHTTGRTGLTLKQFADVVGPGDLRRLLKRVHDKFRMQTVFGPTQRDRFSIPLGLGRLYGKRIGSPRSLNLAEELDLYPALAFASTAVEIWPYLSPVGRKNLRGRLIDSLKPDRDARPLAQEFRAAIHLAQKGWDLEFADLERRAQYDYIARRADQEIEVECKTVSGDTGSPVHQADFELFANKVIDRVGKHTFPLLRVDIALRNRLPKQAAAMAEIVGAIEALIQDPPRCLLMDAAKVTVAIIHPDTYDLKADDFNKDAARVLQSVREERNGSVFGIGSNEHLLVVHVYSEQPTGVGGALYEALSSGSSQMSRARPGIVWTHFVDLASSELETLVASYRGGEGTALHAAAVKLFLSISHDHLAGLLFSAEIPPKQFGGSGSLIIHQPFYSQRGALYPLWNRNCRLNQPFKELL